MSERGVCWAERSATAQPCRRCVTESTGQPISPSPTHNRRFTFRWCNGFASGNHGDSRRRHMAEAKTAVAHKPVWTDLAATDPKAAAKFYTAVFGWKGEVSPDPQYGGYATAQDHGKDVAGITPKQMEQQPAARTLYTATPNPPHPT